MIVCCVLRSYCTSVPPYGSKYSTVQQVQGMPGVAFSPNHIRPALPYGPNQRPAMLATDPKEGIP